MSGQNYKTSVTTVGGDIYLSLPDNQYIEMTPDQARKMGSALFIKANEAEGKAAPELIVLQPSQATS